MGLPLSRSRRSRSRIEFIAAASEDSSKGMFMVCLGEENGEVGFAVLELDRWRC